jgi:hypothetical protein
VGVAVGRDVAVGVGLGRGVDVAVGAGRLVGVAVGFGLGVLVAVGCSVAEAVAVASSVAVAGVVRVVVVPVDPLQAASSTRNPKSKLAHQRTGCRLARTRVCMAFPLCFGRC